MNDCVWKHPGLQNQLGLPSNQILGTKARSDQMVIIGNMKGLFLSGDGMV